MSQSEIALQHEYNAAYPEVSSVRKPSEGHESKSKLENHD